MGLSSSRFGEDDAIAAIQQILAAQRLPAGWLGIGDDAAVTDLTPGDRALTTTDLLVEGVHFRMGTIPPRDLGWKAIAVNASDIAAMGGSPRWATFSVALGPDVELGWLQELYRGALELAERIGLMLVGGDTVGSPGPTVLAVTVVGEALRPRLRSEARPGDAVLVTGPLGGSAAGLWVLEHPGPALALDEATRRAVVEAHRRPVPHLEAGQAIARLASHAAMMDNSDGLARSALALAQAGGCAVVLEAPALPVDTATRAVAAHAAVDPLDWALYGGEEYHLVFTCPPRDVPAIRAVQPVWEVGRCLAGQGGWVELQGKRLPLDPGRVYQHFDAPGT